MPKATIQNLDAGQLDLMLKHHLDAIRQCMIQKTAGQRSDDPKEYVNMQDIGTHVNCVVIESMCLYLSGYLDRMEEKEDAGTD